MKKNILVIKKMSKIEEELIQDLTQIAIEETKYFSDFPADLKILNVKLIKGPDGWGGKEYALNIQYEFNGTKYEISRVVYSDVKSTLIDLLFEILDHYRRCHLNQ